MPVYWSMLAVTAIIGLLSYSVPKKKVIVEGVQTSRIRIGFVVLLLVYIIFFMGFRDKVLDTSGYIKSFNELPTTFQEILAYVNIVSSGKGFYFLAGIFKIYISRNHYVWLFFLASVSCIFLFKTLYKYSIDFPLSAYLFIADSTFTWLLNGTRQFLVVCVLFGFTDWLIAGKKVRYILLALALTTIHSSAIFIAIIVMFVTSEEIMSKKMIIFMVLTVIGTYFSEQVFSFLGETSEVLDYSSTLGANGGSNILRLFIAAIPVIIVLLNHEHIKKIATPSIRLAINMSLVGDCFYFAATFTNGILVGRMPIYFTVYNLYLLPWVIRKCFTKESRKIVWGLSVLFYLLLFYYQMYGAWGGLTYISEFLNLKF